MIKKLLPALIFLWIAFEVFGDEKVSQLHLEQLFAKVKQAELPAEVAAIIKKSKAADLEKTTILVLKAAIAMNPAAASVVVGSVVRSRPEIASLAAATAAELQPNQAGAIARAAASAAPAQAAKVVLAVCRSVPNQYRNVALAVATAVPKAAREILLAVAAAVPELGPAIESALAQMGLKKVSVAAVLEEAGRATAPPTANGPQPLGPKIGPPFIPLAGTVKTITPDTSHDVPPGGRDYARP